MQRMIVGMRIVKTSLAVAISAFLVLVLKLESPFLASMAALITMQGSLADSFNMAKYRILGTVFGAVIGIAGAYAAHGNPLVLGLGIGIIIFVADKLRWHRAIAIASIVFASIMLGNEGQNTIISSYSRVLDTMIGIVVAVVVNFSVSRPLSRDRVLISARALVEKCRRVLGMIICNEEGVTLTDIAKEMKLIEQELPGVKAEMRMHLIKAKGSELDIDSMKLKVDTLYRHIALLATMESRNRLNHENAQLVGEIYGANLEAAEEYDYMDIIFNYHLGVSLAVLRELYKELGLYQAGQPI